MKSKEQRLTERLKNGDLKALGKVMEEYSGYVCAAARNFSGGVLSDDESDKIAADVFCKLWSYRQGLNPEYGLCGFLSAVTRSVMAKRDILPSEDDKLFGTVSELLGFLDTLPEDEREVFERSFFLGQSAKNISEISGIPEDETLSKLNGTYETLKNKLAKGGHDYE